MGKRNKAFVPAVADTENINNSRGNVVPITNDGLIQMAIKKGDIAMLEKIIELRDRCDKAEAKKAYHKAMADFKSNCPVIEKDKKANFSTKKDSAVMYHYADLGRSSTDINAAIAVYGFSVSWLFGDSPAPKTIKVTCKITHALGHSEETSLVGPHDNSGSKNDIQAVGSSAFYLERYTLFALLGVAPLDVDNDGAGAPVEVISEKQLSTIVDMINEKAIDEIAFLRFMHAEEIEQIAAKDYNKAMTTLQKAKGGKVAEVAK